MKKLFSVILAVLMILSAVPVMDIDLKADALGFITHEGCYGGVYYYGYEDSTATVVGLCSGYCGKDYTVKIHDVAKRVAILSSVVLEAQNPDDGVDTFTVVNVGVGAFADTDLELVTIAEGVSEISSEAFRRSSVERVIIPRTIKKIGTRAFSACNKLTSVEIQDGDVALSIELEAFKSCSSLRNLSLKRVKTIDCYAFDSVNLDNITFAENVSINQNAFIRSNINNMVFGKKADVVGAAFSDCTIGKLVLPETTNSLSSALFYNTVVEEAVIPEGMIDVSVFLPVNQRGLGFTLNKISADKNNPNYVVVDDVLFNKYMTTLLYYSPSKTDKAYTIPDGVFEIVERAFFECNNLEKIIMSDSMLRVCKYAFYKCNNLKNVVLSKNLQYIESYGFNFCPIEELSVLPRSLKEVSASAFSNHSLKDAYYDGTEEEWNNISYYNVLIYGDNKYIVTSFNPNVTMHFNGGDSEPPTPPTPPVDTPDEPGYQEHIHSFMTGIISEATCEEDGIAYSTCSCGYNYTEILPAKGHKDEDSDYKCDNEGCDYEFEKPESEPEDLSKNCSCNCHSGNLVRKVLWRIVNFLNKIFNIKKKQICDCGINHF